LYAQLGTLTTTAALGASIALTPPKVDAKLSTIEQAMSITLWAWTMMAFGAVGLALEAFAAHRNSNHSFLLWGVSVCHIVCMSVMLGYSASALASLIRLGHWYAFGGPVLGLFISLMHFVFVKRKYVDPMEVVRHPHYE
jgi:hypothetical protein